MYTNRKIDIKDRISFCLGTKSSDNGALIGGILGGTFFLAIIVFVCILVAKKRRQSYAGMLLPFLPYIPLLNPIQCNAQLPSIASVKILFYALVLAMLENKLAK